MRSIATLVFGVPSQPVIVTPAGSVNATPGKRGSVITWSAVAFAIGTKRSAGGGVVSHTVGNIVTSSASTVTSIA